MTTKQALELGRIAASEGRSASPFADPTMMAEIENAKVGEKTKVMKAFNKGWQSVHWTMELV